MNTPAAGRPDKRRLEPLWDRVDANRFRLLGYLVAFALASSVALGLALVYAAGAAVFLAAYLTRSMELTEALYRLFFAGGPLRLWLIGLAFGAVYECWAMLRDERWILKRLRATFVPKGELLDSKLALKDMALAAGLPVAPALYLMPDTSVNAFVFKAPGRRAVLGITRGFLKKLTLDEQRAVFANLVARLTTGDTLVSSAVTSLLAPLNLYREYRVKNMDAEDRLIKEMAEQARDNRRQSGNGAEAAMIFVVLLPLIVGGVVVGEIFGAFQRRSQLTAGEKADAEGMLLLKDPRSMVSALEKCVAENNYLVAAGDTFGDVFYCWTGLSSDDEKDPEWRRVARLREVLGVEGWVPDVPEPQLECDLLPGPAPRLEK